MHYDSQSVECHNVHEAENPEDIGDSVVEIADRDFSHDATEGCQGSYTLLVEGECPDCGSNRLTRSVMTLPGLVCVTCPACDTVLHPA